MVLPGAGTHTCRSMPTFLVTNRALQIPVPSGGLTVYKSYFLRTNVYTAKTATTRSASTIFAPMEPKDSMKSPVSRTNELNPSIESLFPSNIDQLPAGVQMPDRAAQV